MATPTQEKLRWYRPLKSLSADGQASPQRSCGAGTDTEVIVCAALTQANDYWNGAIGMFDLDTPTELLQGIWFHVLDFDAAGDELALARALPVSPATGGAPDTFRLYLGGNWRSTTEIKSLKFTAPRNVTGVVIDAPSNLNGPGTGHLSWDASASSLFWRAPGDEDVGAAVVISGDGPYVLFSDSGEAHLEVTVTESSLPVEDAADEIALRVVEESLLPSWAGAENAGSPKTRYHLLVVKNEDGADAMADTVAYIESSSPLAASTTLVDAFGVDTGAMRVSSVDGWPKRSFWIHNESQNDIRYVKYRTARTLYVAAAGAGHRGFSAVPWLKGSTISVYPEVDISIEAPTLNQFDSPADEETEPSGANWSAPEIYAAGLSLGSLANGALYGIWVRETILADHVTREGFGGRVIVEWENETRSGVLLSRSIYHPELYQVYYREVGDTTWTYADEIDAAATPLQAALPTLADGEYELKIEMQGYHWDPHECLIRKRFRIVSGVLATPIPSVSGVLYSYGETETEVSFLYRRQADLDDPGSFGLWQSGSSPVSTAGTPDVELSFGGVRRYSGYITQAGLIYVAVAAIKGGIRGPSVEIVVPAPSVTPDAPEDQYATRE